MFRPGWDIVVGVMCEALDNIASLFSKSDAQRRGDALIEAGYDLGTDPDDFLAPSPDPPNSRTVLGGMPRAWPVWSVP